MSTMLGDKSIVPMVMFHTVGTENMDWEYRHIAEPVVEFEAKVSALVEAGFNFIFWSDLYEYMHGNKELELPAIVLTFDDGYLDNWTHVYPILKRYGAKGTIFMSTDFVDPSTVCRPTIEDVERGDLSEDKLRIDGFLNWEEMRAMELSGVIDIQSHTRTHTWYYSGPDVVDFWSPVQREHIWMAWNARPERKPFYLAESQWDNVALGTPVYAHEKSLEGLRFFPAQEIAQEMCAHVEDAGGRVFFDKPGWKDELQSVHGQLLAKYEDKCRFETPDEQKARMMDELVTSKTLIEQELNKSVDFICWPGGGYIDITMDYAREAGYKSWTLSSRDSSDFRNVPGANPLQVKRIGSSPRQFWKGRDLGFTNGNEFLSHVRRHQHSDWHKWRGRVLKALRMVGARS